MSILYRALAALSLAALPLACMADGMQFGGTFLNAPPCVINNDRPITASFGDVLIENIDGSYKTITLPYDLDCSRALTNQVRIQVQSYWVAWFLPGSMQVEGNWELVITFKKDGSTLPINTWTDFDASKKPVLQAVLSKMTPDSEIIEGAFSSTATLMVEYR